MLAILDKYIIRKYLLTFAFTVLLVSLLACVIDLSDHLDNFQRSNAPLTGILFEYYLFFIPFIITLVWPIICLVSVIFITSRIANDSEVLAMLNTGMSYGRLMRPYLIAAGILTVMNMALNHFIVPIGSKIKTDFENEFVYRMTDRGKTHNVHLFTSENDKIYIKWYNKKDSTAKDVMIEHFEGGELKSVLYADKIKALSTTKQWKLTQYYERSFDGMRIPVVEGDEKVMGINLLPEDFVAYDNAKDALTTPELMRHISRQKSRGAGGTALYEVELHRRHAQPFIVLILTIIGVSLSSRKVRGGMGLNLALGVGLGAVYVFLFQFSSTLSINGEVPAVLAVWSPSLLFVFVAAYLMANAQK